MKFLKIQRIAFQSILKNRMRSLLTSLGIIIGVCSVIVMVAIGQGSQQKIESEIDSMGTNLIMIFPGASKMGGISRGAGSRNSLKLDDYELIKEQAQTVLAVSPSIRASGQIIAGSSNWNSQIEGVSPDFLTIKQWELDSGSFFTEKDDKAKKKVCVIGKTIADEMFPDMDPVGQRVRIRNTPFTILGVLKAKGQNSWGQDQDDIVLAPSKTVLYRLAGGKRINMMYVSSLTADMIEETKEEVKEIMYRSHDILVEDDEDFTLRTQTEITDMASSTSKTLTLLLGAIAGVSLLVGGIGIMNIMLVSVTERTREIGIRLSVGARAKDVLLQFLTEAITLSFSGGAIGILLATIISYWMERLTSLNTVINPMIVIIAFAFSGAVGIFFGYYPAKKASQLNPIDALRYE